MREEPSAFGRQVRDALAHLHDPGWLQLHPLARALPAGPDQPGAGRALQRALHEAIDGLRPGRGGRARGHELLTLRYVEGLAVPAVQARLGIAHAEYFREQARAVAAVAALLRERLDGRGGPVPTAASPSARHNLPLYLTALIGREAAVAELRRLLATTRLLTATGTGGCGKTRLAVQVAAELLDEYPDGVWLVELAPIADPALVPAAVAALVGVREQACQPIDVTLGLTLAARRMLLLLDNCEHVLDGVARLVDALLREGPGVRVLATSREVLGIAGEVSWRVPSLPAPEAERLATMASGRAAAAESYPAVRLFVERAAAAQPGFALTDADALAVARICQRLDGIPLAIELAAVRVRGLSPEHLAARLDQRFRLLTGGSRTALPRQQTLRATVDWSYELLSDGERLLFDRLAVFSGGFSLEAAEHVCADPAPTAAADGGAGFGESDPDGPGHWRERIGSDQARSPIPLSSADVLDLLLRLVDKSLVVAEAGAGAPDRYRLLETLRQYARERLLERGEADALSERHAGHYLRLAEQAELESYGPRQESWLAWFRREHDNLRAALHWYTDGQRTQEALRLAGALAHFWGVLQYAREGVEHLSRALSLPGADEPTAARARALDGLASLEYLGAGEREAMLGHAEALLALGRDWNDPRLIGRGLYLINLVQYWASDFAAATATCSQALSWARAADDCATIAQALQLLGCYATLRGDQALGRALLEEATATCQQIGDSLGQIRPLFLLASAAYFAGDLGAARRHCLDSLAIARAMLGRRGCADSLENLGWVLTAAGEPDAAREPLQESIAIRWETGQWALVPWGLERLAGLACAERRWTRALRLGGAAAALRESFASPLPDPWRAEVEAWLDEARTALADPDAAASAWEDGGAMPLDRAVAYALSRED
jgi:predicted ATPase